ncbi:hypothetical protein sS8_0264 [Methylocaldum marinum]|jgi:hypothetical protein|uniref:Uncharacterized protein n=1 Tax=Methylocaldum marinum TaxID=1432792 RepID=A0A286P3L0_9GAMM|nr:hypothetical protein [Methylocaldum marinum]BBA32232.1 hypothetical protein sS8_0264 [Methylocaldum marinum]
MRVLVITDEKHLSVADVLVEGDVLFVTGTAAGIRREFGVPAFKLDDGININANGLPLAGIDNELVTAVLKSDSVIFL